MYLPMSCTFLDAAFVGALVVVVDVVFAVSIDGSVVSFITTYAASTALNRNLTLSSIEAVARWMPRDCEHSA